MDSPLRGSVLLPVPIERAWELWVDAARYTQWQSMLLAVRDMTGPASVAGTTYVLDHGPKMQRTVRVLVAERPVRHVIEQSGMGIHDETTATFEPEGSGTRLTIVVAYRLGKLMSLLTRLDRRSRTERELQRELDRLVAIAARTPPPARVGGMYVAEAGAVRRRLTVLAVDDDRVHIRVHPGHLRDQDPDSLVPTAPKPLSDELDLRPIDPPFRASVDAMLVGLPFLRRDGGHGVGHLALSLDAWADSLARESGDEALMPSDVRAVDAWRSRRAPTVGVDADLDLAPLCTLRIDARAGFGEMWTAAKVLRSTLRRVHLKIVADRWSERPVSIPPRAWWPEPLTLDATSDLGAVWPVMIGHYPLSRTTFSAAKPRFAGIATLEHEELDGFREWQAAHAGTFESLAPVVSPGGQLPPADLLTPASGVALGDRARVKETPLTAAKGLADRIGTVYGHTTPSLAHSINVVGASAKDVAVALWLEGGAETDDVVWVAAELVEFVDHEGATEISVAGRRLTRASDGSWRAHQ